MLQTHQKLPHVRGLGVNTGQDHGHTARKYTMQHFSSQNSLRNIWPSHCIISSPPMQLFLCRTTGQHHVHPIFLLINYALLQLNPSNYSYSCAQFDTTATCSPIIYLSFFHSVCASCLVLHALRSVSNSLSSWYHIMQLLIKEFRHSPRTICSICTCWHI